MTLYQLFIKHSLNRSAIAQKAGLKPTTFRNKLDGNQSQRFTDSEKERLKATVRELDREMMEDLEKI